MTRQKITSFALLFALVISFFPGEPVQAAGTDEIKEYTIAIVPQDDGSLMNTYTVNWCVISNAAGPLTWINIGMPNESYQIVSFSGDAINAKPDNSGFDYKMRIDLTREVNAGDCVTVSTVVHQFRMGYLDNTTSEISYQFTPGWFNDVPVDHLLLSWQLPANVALLKSLDPKPNTQNDAQATWESVLQPGDKFTIAVTYDKAAFPNFNTDQLAPASTPPINYGQTASGSTNSGNNGSQPSGISPATGIIVPTVVGTCACVPILIILIILVVIFSILGSVGRVYNRGGYFGGYHGGGGWIGGGGDGGDLTRPDRSGGCSGNFGGRGSSCACVSSGCACACAGGGRAGCSRKSFDVSGLFSRNKEKEIS
jgi:hypothetical protein